MPIKVIAFVAFTRTAINLYRPTHFYRRRFRRHVYHTFVISYVGSLLWITQRVQSQAYLRV